MTEKRSRCVRQELAQGRSGSNRDDTGLLPEGLADHVNDAPCPGSAHAGAGRSSVLMIDAKAFTN